MDTTTHNKAIEKTYNDYWKKRQRGGSAIPDSVPVFLRKYTAYGSILHQIPAGSTILDVGCGDGVVTQLYADIGKVIGIDISDEALKIARKRGMSVRKQDLNSVPYPFPDRSFDTVVITDVLEHLFDPVAVLRELKRLLTDDGRLIVTVPNFARLGNRIRMFIGDPIDLLHFSKYGDTIEHLSWFTVPKLNEYFRITGFPSVSYKPTGLQSGSFIFGLLGVASLGKFLTVVARKHVPNT